jgi:hypothetical protein
MSDLKRWAKMNAVLEIFFALGIVTMAVYVLLDLRHAYRHRSVRWGKRGEGLPMSALSIIVMSSWMFALSGAILVPYAIDRIPPTLIIDIFFAGFCAGIACGVGDMIIDHCDKKEPERKSLSLKN